MMMVVAIAVKVHRHVVTADIFGVAYLNANLSKGIFSKSGISGVTATPALQWLSVETVR